MYVWGGLTSKRVVTVYHSQWLYYLFYLDCFLFPCVQLWLTNPSNLNTSVISSELLAIHIWGVYKAATTTVKVYNLQQSTRMLSRPKAYHRCAHLYYFCYCSCLISALRGIVLVSILRIPTPHITLNIRVLTKCSCFSIFWTSCLLLLLFLNFLQNTCNQSSYVIPTVCEEQENS